MPWQKTEPGRNPEWQARIVCTKHAAHCRSENQANTDGDVDPAKPDGSPPRRHDIGYVGAANRHARRRRTRNKAANQQHRKIGRKRHQQIVQRQAEIRQQDNRATAQAVGQRSLNRCADELHEGSDGTKQSKPAGRTCGITVEERQHQPEQHRNHDGHCQHVECDSDQNEAQRGTLGPARVARAVQAEFGGYVPARRPARRKTRSYGTGLGGAGSILFMQ